MLTRTFFVAVLLAAVALGGCHVLLPLSSTDRGRDRAVERGPNPELPGLLRDVSVDRPSIRGDRPGPDKQLLADAMPPCASASSLCSGLALLVDFEAAGYGDRVTGAAPYAINPTAQLAAGLLGDGGKLNGGGWLEFHPMPSYSTSAGTYAVWLKPEWTFPCTSKKTFIEVTSGINTCGGPYLACDPAWDPSETGNGVLGIGVQGSQLFKAVLGHAQDSTLLQNGWVHLVGTWTGSSLGLSVNGSKPVTWSGAWSTQGTAELFFVGGGVDGVLDEVAMWNRPLSLTEVACLYQLPTAGTSLAALCNL